MKIILIHNFYGTESPSGENLVFNAERKLLQENGNDVEVFNRYSDSIRNNGVRGRILGAVSTPWNPFAGYALSKLVSKFKPDIVHAHNTFPLISPSVFYAIGKSAAKVLTLHNYRLLCPAAIPVRNGVACTECIVSKSVMPALKFGCYRNSRLATLPIAAGVALHRSIGTWQNKIDAYIALSDFQRNLMTLGGLPEKKIHIKPNFYPGKPAVLPFANRQNYVVFVGRLGAEKGVNFLLDSWRIWGASAPVLRIVGEGPLRPYLEEAAKNLPIEFLGQISHESAQELIANSRLLILPSICYEGFPMVIREAFALGTPVAVSNLGPLPSIVQHGFNGVLFKAGDHQSLYEVVSNIIHDDQKLIELSAGARASFENLYDEASNYKELLKIYRNAIELNSRVN